MPGRRFGANVLERETLGRVYSNSPSAITDMPVLMALDVQAACPGLSRIFMRAVFLAIGVPAAFEAVLDQLCAALQALVVSDGPHRHACLVE